MGDRIPRKLRNARHRSGLWRTAARDAFQFAVDYKGRRGEIARRRFFEMAAEITPAFAVDADGVRYFISAEDKGDVGRSLYFHGAYERELVRQVDGLLRAKLGRGLEERVFVDIGANIGTASVSALKFHDASRVVAAEPHPRNFQLLRLNLVANDLEHRAVTVQVAVTSEPGSVPLEVAAGNPGDNRVRLGPQAAAAGRFGEDRRAVIEVDARRLDDVLEVAGVTAEEIGVVWIDTQGHEAHVLGGAPRLAAAGVPVLLEYWPYGLRRAGGVDALHELITAHYAVILDLGRQEGPGGESAHPVHDLAELPRRYEDGFTNLLLLPDRPRRG